MDEVNRKIRGRGKMREREEGGERERANKVR
jgi:hypothetical protein